MKQDAPAIDAPYPGLRPFDRHESRIFFGRGSHTTTMLRSLKQQNFLAVVGSSGCGKSSLVRAGLLPAVAGGLLDGQTAWKFVIVRPGDLLSSGVEPFANLAGQLVSSLQPEVARSDAAGETLAYREATLRMGPNGLLDAIRDSLAADDSSHVFVLVDQFEEIFRYRNDAPSSDQRRQQNDAVAFVDLLLSTARAQDPRVFVSLTMRSDFLGDCDAFHGLPEAINNAQFLPPRLTRDELRDVIELPLQVKAFRGTIDPQVTADLLNAISDSQDLLPLLQHVLRRMWTMAAPVAAADTQTERRITLKHYQESGGLARALDRHATGLYDSLARGQQRIAERLFRSLAERSPKGHLIRRLSKVGEVANAAGVTAGAVIEVLDVFRRPGVSFLVTTPEGALRPETSIDISHESLLRQWRLIKKWVRVEYEAATSYRRLLDAVSVDDFIDGARLDRALRWRETHQPTPAWAMRYDGAEKAGDSLLSDGLKLIDDSVAERERLAKAAEKQHRRRYRRLVRATIFMTLLAIAMTLLTIWALDKTKEAQDAEGRAYQAKESANVERDKAEAITEFLTDDLLAAVAPSAESGKGRDVLMRDVLDAAAERIEEASRVGGRFEERPLVEASIRATLGSTYRWLGEYVEAEPHLERALLLRRRELGEEDPDTLDSMHNLGLLYKDQGRYDEAEPLFDNTLEIRKRILPEEHPDRLDSMNSLGVLYKNQRRYDEAEALLRETLEIRQRVLDEEHPSTLYSMNSLASLYTDQGRHDEAESLYLETLKIKKDVLGKEDPKTLNSMFNLARLYQKQKLYAKAEPLYVEMLQIRRRILGQEHPFTLATMNNLAILYNSQRLYDEAEALFGEKLKVQKRVRGEEHPDTLRTMRILVRFYEFRGRTDDARPLVSALLEAGQRRADRPEASASDKNAHACDLLNCEPADLRDPQTALCLARDACATTDNANPVYLHTLALAQYMTGDTPAAIETETKALSLLPPDAPGRDGYEAALARFEAALKEADTAQKPGGG